MDKIIEVDSGIRKDGLYKSRISLGKEMYDYDIVCDETNNSKEDNVVNVDIILKNKSSKT